MTKKTSFVIHIALLLFIYPLLYIQTARSSLGSTDIPNLENGPARTNLPSINEIPSTEPPSTTTVNPLTFSRSLDPLIEYGIAPEYKSHNITIYRHVTQYLKGEKKLCIPIPSLLAINKHTLNLFQLHYESFVHSSLKLYLVPSLNIFSLAENDIRIPYDIIESGIVNKLISIYPSTIDQHTAPQTTQQNNVIESTAKQPSLPYAPLNFEQYTIEPLNITAILDHLLDELNDRNYISRKQKDIEAALTNVEINIKNIKDMNNNEAKAFLAKLVPEDLNSCSLEILEILGNTFESFLVKKKNKKVMFQKNKDTLVESLKKLKDQETITKLNQQESSIPVNSSTAGSDKSNDVTTKANTKQSELSNKIHETEISIRAHEKCIKRYKQKLKAILEYKQPLDILNASVQEIKMTLQEVNHLKYFSDINFLLTVPKAIEKIDKIEEDLIKTDKNRLLLCLFLDSIASYKFELYEHYLMQNNPDSMTTDNLNNHIIFNRKYYDVYKYLWSHFTLTSTTYDKDEQEEICTFFHCSICNYPELQIPLIKRKQSAIFASRFTQGNIFDLFKTENPRFNFVLNVIRFDQRTWWISDWKKNNMKFTWTMCDTRDYLKKFVNTYQKVAPLVAPLKDDSSSAVKNHNNNNNTIAKSEPQEHTPQIATSFNQHKLNDVHPEKNTSSDIIQNKKIAFYSHINIEFIRECYNKKITDVLSHDPVYIIDLTKSKKKYDLEQSTFLGLVKDFIKTHKTVLQFFPISQIKEKPENFILSKEIFRAIRRIKKMCDHFPISALIKETLNPKTLIIDNVANWNSFKKLFTDYSDLIADLATICNKKVTLTNVINSNQLQQLASFFNTITICIESENDQKTVAEKNNVDQIELIIDCLSYINSIQPKQENSKAPIDKPSKSDKESVEHGESNYDNIPTITIDWSKTETLHLSVETLKKIIEKPILHKLITNHISSLYLKTKHFTNKIPLKIDTLLEQIKSMLALNTNNTLTLDQIDLLCTIKDIPVLYEQLKTEFSDKTVRIESCIGQDWPGTIDVIAPLFKKVEIAIQDYEKTENRTIFNTPLNHNNVIFMFIDNVNLVSKYLYDKFFKYMLEKSEQNKWILNWDQCKRISLSRYDINVGTIAFIKKISNKEIVYKLYSFDKKIITFTSDMNNIDLSWEPLKEDSTTFLLTDSQLQAIQELNFSLGFDTPRIKEILKKNFPNARTLYIEKKIDQYDTNYFALLCSFFQKIFIQAQNFNTINTLFEDVIDLIPSNEHHKVTLSMPQKFQFNESTNAKLHNNNLITVKEGFNTILITKDEYQKICEGLIPIHKIDDRCIFNVTNADYTTPQQITAKDIKKRAKPIQEGANMQTDKHSQSDKSENKSVEKDKSSSIIDPKKLITEPTTQSTIEKPIQQEANMQTDQPFQSDKSEDKSVEKDKSSSIIDPKQLISEPTTQSTIEKPIQQEANMQTDQPFQSGESKKKGVKQDALSYINRIYTFLSNKIIPYKKLTVGCFIGISILLNIRFNYIDLPACFTY